VRPQQCRIAVHDAVSGEREVGRAAACRAGRVLRDEDEGLVDVADD
jgi:hypothetical protein